MMQPTTETVVRTTLPFTSVVLVNVHAPLPVYVATIRSRSEGEGGLNVAGPMTSCADVRDATEHVSATIAMYLMALCPLHDHFIHSTQ